MVSQVLTDGKKLWTTLEGFFLEKQDELKAMAVKNEIARLARIDEAIKELTGIKQSIEKEIEKKINKFNQEWRDKK